ncbi:hypothetical protein GA0115236_10619 [Streptomyces sp. IgraMP-1]|nr:hypothetical protein GA0115236_10619 [Streptomyces sp. IgraMP-1]
MDVQKKLDEIVDTVGSARSMPMSASCVINRAELLALLEEVREALPGSLAQAQELIGDREQMVEQARQEAERIIQSAHAERGSLVSGTAVAQRSQDEADRILAEARAEAEEIRAQADDYVDSKLANFEVVLTKTIGSVGRGREKLLGADPTADDGYDDPEAPERSHDPETLRRRADDYVSAKLGAFEAVLGKTLEAVGRGRQKLHGRVATDELAALGELGDDAAQAATSDADYLAGLAGPTTPPPPAADAPGTRRPRSPAAGPVRRPGPARRPGPVRLRRPRPAGRLRLPAAGVRPAAGRRVRLPGPAAARRLRLRAAGRPAGVPAAGLPGAGRLRRGRVRRTAGAPGAARQRARRDQPLRHRHDQRRGAAPLRTGALTARRGRRPGPDWETAARSSILTVRSCLSTAPAEHPRGTRRTPRRRRTGPAGPRAVPGGIRQGRIPLDLVNRKKVKL